MGRTYDGIPEPLQRWIERQPVFFVGTAPASGGHVNVSPKGGPGSLVVLSPSSVAYLDLTGSGVETIAHLRDDGRITVMLCAFEGPPRIVRLQGTGRAVLPTDEGFADLLARFPAQPGTRSVIVADLDRIADSCGYAVPELHLVRHRDRLTEWAEAKGEDGVATYRRQKNATSIDGLPGL